jgi:hypothetical protein
MVGMSDAIDALSKAMDLNKQLAAKTLVRKDELDAERARLVAAGADTSAVDLELAENARALQAARKEIAELRHLAAQHRGPNEVARLMADDPILQSLEDAALDRAREHIAETSALAGFDDVPELDATLPAASALAPPLTREDKDAQARAEFERLRKKREEDQLVISGKVPPKKTL